MYQKASSPGQAKLSPSQSKRTNPGIVGILHIDSRVFFPEVETASSSLQVYSVLTFLTSQLHTQPEVEGLAACQLLCMLPTCTDDLQ